MRFQVSKEIQDISLDKLRASVNKAKKTRSFEDRPSEELIASIKENGVIVPIMVRADGTIVDGLCRIAAATKVGRTTIPTIVLES